MSTFFDTYHPGEHEKERASNSYLMSLVAIVAGLPFPIINLLATFFFYLGNRSSTYFVRWHCMQALLSQLSLLLMNAAGFTWTMTIIFTSATISNSYIAYIITIALFNIIDFIATMYTAIEVRKGRHVAWWLFGNLTHIFCKP